MACLNSGLSVPFCRASAIAVLRWSSIYEVIDFFWLSMSFRRYSM
jgi:hypothetical protein